MNSSLYDSYKTLRVFESFAGYGSQSLALRNLGVKHEVVAISEIDKYALQAYYSLHDEDIPNLGDISKLRVEDIPKHDLFTYSFPCQDISVAGKQAGIEKGQTRSGLLYECERIIEHCKPKYLLMENVKNLVGKKFKVQFDEWLEYLEGLGYTNYWKVLNAKDYGVPQNRERVFVISVSGEHNPYEFPKPIKLDKVIKDILEDRVDEKYYLSNDTLKKFIPNVFSKYTLNKSSVTPQIMDVGYIKKSENGTKHQSNTVLDEQHLMRTLTACDYKSPQLITIKGNVDKIIQVGNTENWDNPQRGRIYLKEGISHSLNTVVGGGLEPKIICEQRSDEGLRFFKDNLCGTIRTIDSGGDKRVIEQAQNSIEYNGIEVELPIIAASRGRNPENSSDRTVGSPTQQRLEINTKGTSNTITTVQKDNYVIENNIKPNLVGGIGEKNFGKQYRQGNRIYDGAESIAMCLNSQPVGNAGGHSYLYQIDNFRIRKLTPKECFRLMGMNDNDIDKIQNAGISNSQQYKMAGNSIVINVLEEIFRNLFIGDGKEKIPCEE